ncbi:MAG: AsmA-like C-terminal region-containing protein, partial [Acidobacteriota bacterium]
LEDSHLTVSRFEIDQTDSQVVLRTDLHLLDEELEVDFGLKLENFHYGPIVRALDPEAEGDGTLDLDTELGFRGGTIDELLASGSGHFDFTLYPHAVNTSVLDLWTASLGSVLRVLNPRNESELNCLVGRFSIDQGKMQAESLVLDTSSLRAAGRGNIDLSDGMVELKLTPRPKRRTFLYLATPVRVSGTVDDPDIHVTAGGLAGTAFRIYAWAFTVYREIFRKPLPRDGSDICVSPPPRPVAPDVIE